MTKTTAPVVEHFWTTIYIGGTIPAGLGPDLADHTFPESAHANLVGSHVFTVSGDQTFRYTGASTDHAVIHIDDEAARRAGFPSKFLQGLCTFAMCSGAVVKVGADGDPDRLRRLACRFSSPVFPRNNLPSTCTTRKLLRGSLGRREAAGQAILGADLHHCPLHRIANVQRPWRNLLGTPLDVRPRSSMMTAWSVEHAHVPERLVTAHRE